MEALNKILDFLTSIQTWILVITFLGGYVLSAYRKLREPDKAQNARLATLEKGVRSLLRTQIIGGIKICVSQGYRDEEDTTLISKQFEAYEALGGNGIAREYYEKFMKLPLEG